MNHEEAQVRILKVLLYGQLLIEANDDLEETPFFKKTLKHTVNKATQEVEKQIKTQIERVYKADNEFCTNIFNQIDNAIGKIAEFGVDEMPMINKLLDEYKKDPKYWKDNLIVQFNKVV